MGLGHTTQSIRRELKGSLFDVKPSVAAMATG